MCVLHLSIVIADHAHSTHCMIFFANVVSLVACFSQLNMTTVLPYNGLFLQYRPEYLPAELPTTIHSCSWHGYICLKQWGSITPLYKTFTLPGGHSQIVTNRYKILGGACTAYSC